MKYSDNLNQEEMHLYFTLQDAVEMAHKIGYTDWMELFLIAFLKAKPQARELPQEEKQRQLDLFDDWTM